MALAHHETMLENGFYDRLNKLMYCPLCCLGYVYAGEIGITALAGDIGKWAAMAVPDEANWIARFIESFKLPAKA